MHFVYIDESKDHNNPKVIYSALLVNVECWREIFDKIAAARGALRKKEGIYIAKELHACEFVAGKGKIAPFPIYKDKRAEIFKKTMDVIVWLGKEKEHKDFTLMNSINDNEYYAFERLINRIQKTMETFNSHALLFFDEGQEVAFTRRIRRMKVFNPIPSDRGAWEGGSSTKNITIDRILEDPIFKDSQQSYFIQLIDFVAYALLRKEIPIASKTALGIHEAFEKLRPVCYPHASRKDPLGIIR